jgi:Domain of unknown function (DUF222)
MLGDTLAAAIDELLDVDPTSLSDDELHKLVVALGRQMNRLQAGWCRLIRDWDVRKVWADNGSKAPGARLSRECRMRKSVADHLVHQARALATMSSTAEAFAAGELNGDHVDLLASANTSGREAAFASDEAELVEQCQTPWFSNAVRVVDYWKHRVDAESGEDEAERVRQGRNCSIGTGWRGEGNLKAVFDPVGWQIFEEELHRICEQLRLQDERDGTVRTIQQRRLDALVEMAMRSATAPADGLRPRPLLTVLLGDEAFRRLCELGNGVVIAPGQVLPYLSDADIERIVNDPPNRRFEASHRRSFVGAMRRVIEVRDRHCQHESGCDVRASRCDVDHVTPRGEGGTTCYCNGRLLCPTHNRIPALRNPNRPSKSDSSNVTKLPTEHDDRQTWNATDPLADRPDVPRPPPAAS